MTQQHTLDSDRGKKLSAGSLQEQHRRASVSVPFQSTPHRDTDNKVSLAAKTLEGIDISKSGGTSAPIISVSSVADDAVVVEPKAAQEATEQEQLQAPLAESDPESSGRDSPSAHEQQGSDHDQEAKANEVCPWEDG